MNTKKRISYNIISKFYDEESYFKAEKNFYDKFVNKVAPIDTPVIKIECKNYNIVELIKIVDESLSKSEIRRLILDNAISINNSKITDIFYEELIGNNVIEIKVGKKKFFKVKGF